MSRKTETTPVTLVDLSAFCKMSDAMLICVALYLQETPPAEAPDTAAQASC